MPYVFEPYEFSTEINALIQLKKPYPKSYRKPRIASFMAAKYAIVGPVWSNSFVLPSLVLFRSLRLYGTHLDLIVLVPTSDTTDVKNNYFDNKIVDQMLKEYDECDKISVPSKFTLENSFLINLLVLVVKSVICNVDAKVS